jgi:hypothetical protein
VIPLDSGNVSGKKAIKKAYLTGHAFFITGLLTSGLE